jgi:glyoxylate reductase
VNLSPETKHLINAETLSRMKPTAVLVNTSRGPVVDQIALADALRDGTIWAAALDVTDPEPILMDDPLVALDNCLIVPHIASASRATRSKMAAMAAANLIAGVRGEPLPTEVPLPA